MSQKINCSVNIDMSLPAIGIPYLTAEAKGFISMDLHSEFFFPSV
jgi:hypothetical protein